MSREKDVKAFLEKVAEYGSVLGLSSITALMEQLHNPQDKLNIIHVAGTNGKGSTIAFLSSVLRRVGYKVGCYTSPAVFAYEEKFSINGEDISWDTFCDKMLVVKNACEQMVLKGYEHPTLFEVETALAFYYFAEEDCDYVLLEVGMGGALDATNVINKSLCSVFSSIGRDHMQFLGNTIEEIAKEKAGIMKKRGRAISIWQEPKVENTLTRVAEEKGTTITFGEREEIEIFNRQPLVFSYKEFSKISIQMVGSYQLDNAILALETIRCLRSQGITIPEEAVQKGMESAFWPGRMELVNQNPDIYMDGAHNLPAAKRLRETIQNNFTNRTITFIIGVLADKEHKELLKELLPLARTVITVTPDNSRALSAHALAEEVKELGFEVYESGTIKDAITYALDAKNDVVIAFGSLSYLQAFKCGVLQWTKEHENV